MPVMKRIVPGIQLSRDNRVAIVRHRKLASDLLVDSKQLDQFEAGFTDQSLGDENRFTGIKCLETAPTNVRSLYIFGCYLHPLAIHLLTQIPYVGHK